MRTEFAEFLDQMQHIADKDGIDIQARHIDLLEFYFKRKTKMTPQQAYDDFKTNFLPRWNAITQNGRFTEAAG